MFGDAARQGSPLTGYYGSDGSQHVFFIDTQGHVREIWKSSASASRWSANDLTMAAPSADQPANLPEPSSSLHAYWGDDGDNQHIHYTSSDGHVHELYIYPGRNWAHNDLTALSGAPKARAGSPIGGYTMPDGSQHIHFIDTDHNVCELLNNVGGAWQSGTIRVQSGTAVAHSQSQLKSYYDGAHLGQHVFYTDPNLSIIELFFAPGSGASPDTAGSRQQLNTVGVGWRATNLTQVSGDKMLTIGGGPLGGYYGDADQSQHVNYIENDAQTGQPRVKELFFQAGGTWYVNDLTALSGSEQVHYRNATGLAGYYESFDRSQHVNYIDRVDHLRELFLPSGGAWQNNDLSATAVSDDPHPAPPTLPAGVVLSYFQTTDNTQHIFYIDVYGQVIEFRWSGSVWFHKNLTYEAALDPAITVSVQASHAVIKGTGFTPGGEVQLFYSYAGSGNEMINPDPVADSNGNILSNTTPVPANIMDLTVVATDVTSRLSASGSQ